MTAMFCRRALAGKATIRAKTDPQRDGIFTRGLSDVLDHTTSEIAVGGKLGIGALFKNKPEQATRADCRHSGVAVWDRLIVPPGNWQS